MSQEPESQPAWRTPAANYLALCGVALGVIVLVLLSQGHSLFVCVMVVALGAGGVWLRMSLAPIALVLVVALSQMLLQLSWHDFRWRWQLPARGPIVVADVLLGAAVLAYVVGQYRLQGLRRHIFPPDPRLRLLHRYTRPPGPPELAPGIERKRDLQLVTPVELAVLVVSLPLCALAAQVVWLMLSKSPDVLTRHPEEQWSPAANRMVAMVIGLVGSLVMASALLRHMRLRQMTTDEARLLMQDTLWNETRGAQPWFARWLTWFRLDQKERKERP
jgi:hypothetical protein